jgi:hypothetical protein
MKSHGFTAAVYAVIASLGAWLQIRSGRKGSRIPRLRTVFSRMMRTRSGRVGMVAGWAWLGLHFFVR